MRIFITGATGLIGQRLVRDRAERGDRIVVLSRDAARAQSLFEDASVTIIQGDPSVAGDWQKQVRGCDAVIHLAGAGVADHRWTKKYKQILLSSRIEGTRHIVDAISAAPTEARPSVLISASAIGYYGDAGDRELDESAAPGEDFLAILTAAWEHEAWRAETISAPTPRLVLLRTGVVLDDQGGALHKIMKPFQFFVGGPIGSGRQWMSWIHWRDLIGVVDLALSNDGLHGPINAVSPQPVRNMEFVQALGRAIHRPAYFPTPKFALRMALGEVADAVTASQRVVPARALETGFEHQFPTLDRALADLLR